MERRTIDVDERLPLLETLPLPLQHLFAMFGATVLVPGLHRSLLGDGLSNILSGLAGATPNTTYGENIGVMAITRVFSVWVIGGADSAAIK